MSFDYERVIPAAIPLKRQGDRPKKIDIHSIYTRDLTVESHKGSKLFNEKVAADRKRLGLA